MYINQFIQYIEFERRYSPHTIIAYKEDLTQFFDFLKNECKIESDLEAINHNVIRLWLVHQIESGISAKSINRKMSALRAYYKFLIREKIVDTNPTLKIVVPKIGKRLPEFVPKQPMHQLLDNIKDDNSFKQLRAGMIIELFYLTGMRLSELINLRDADINYFQNTLKVLGKRNKERIIPLTSETIAHLKEYIAERDRIIVSSDVTEVAESKYLFITDAGKKMYPQFVYRLVKQYLGYVVTNKKRSPHVLRHTFATHMLDNGADLNAIKEILGHANLAATQIYTHNTIEKLIHIYKQAHPKA